MAHAAWKCAILSLTPNPIAVDTAQLRAMFSKPYCAPGPIEAQWRELYPEDVHFSDPTQEREGLAAYIAAQEGLLHGE